MRLTLSLLFVFPLTAYAADDPAIVKAEYIYEKASFASCHATTICETKSGLISAWFGGTAEGKADVSIYVSRHRDGKWSDPFEVANGVQSDGKRHPCWNPVLFQPKDGPLMLFYKVGPSPSTWWGELRTSADEGKTWSAATKLPEGILGPVKNKPVQLKDGTILNGSSKEGLKPGPSWQIHFERSSDLGKTWKLITVPVDADGPSCIQPSILKLGGDKLQAIGRTRSGKLFTTTSDDNGVTWSKVGLTELPNPNSGTDAVTLSYGQHLLIYNHTKIGRSPLNVAVSKDGKTWQAALILEKEVGEYSYPAVIQTNDGMVHITYTWKRKLVRHVVIDPKKLTPRDFEMGIWPK